MSAYADDDYDLGGEFSRIVIPARDYPAEPVEPGVITETEDLLAKKHSGMINNDMTDAPAILPSGIRPGDDATLLEELRLADGPPFAQGDVLMRFPVTACERKATFPILESKI